MFRRDFLKTTALAVGGLAAPLPLFRSTAQASAPRMLTIANRTIEVGGKSASVFALTGDDGKPGLSFKTGETFSVSLANRTQEETIIHWHGLTPPWQQDGVADNPLPMLKAGETRGYDFPLAEGGTFWMHAHTLQEQNLLAAPLIVRDPADMSADVQEIVVLLHDFSFRSPQELLDGLTGGKASYAGHGAGHMAGNMGSNMGGNMGGNMGALSGMGMNHGGGQSMMGGMMGGMSGMAGAMDLNDIDYDAYLANDRTLEDPEVFAVEKGGKVRLRIINGAASTAFHISTGALRSTLVSVDGRPVKPVSAATYPMSMAQRIDLLVDIPKEGGAFPVLALREGTTDRTGVILATAGAEIRKLSLQADAEAPALDLEMEAGLSALSPLAARDADRQYMVHLTGDMASYQWAIMGADGLEAKSGERVEIAIMNMSMMAHPMHLHGHAFQVVSIGGRSFSGAMRDTILVPPMQTVTIAFDAGTPGRWPFHCHHLYHMVSGMMSYVEVA